MSRIDITKVLDDEQNTEVPEIDSVSSSFLSDVQQAISQWNYVNKRTPSKTYKPSCLGCNRMMVYIRKGYEQDDTKSEYTGIGMADTGTRRHVAIQEVLEHMKDMGFNWEYLDVGEYVKKKHSEGKIPNTKVTDYRGHECHLKDDDLHISCMCDGIVRNTDTGKSYLFEFKNQISFKAQWRDKIDKSHYSQIIAYATLLDLDEVIMLYENRDNCELKCPAVYRVTSEDKRLFIENLRKVEEMAQENIIPAANKNSGMCKWCDYKSQCSKDGGAMKICDSSVSTQANLGLLQ